MAYCKCCQVEGAIFGPTRSFNGLPVSNVVCGICMRHQRSLPVDLMKKEKDHSDLWAESKREAIEELTELHAEDVARLESRIAAMQEELGSRPVQVVTENLDAEVVDQAHRDAEQAYRSRDHAYLQLTMIHMQHFEAQAGQCRCGIPIEECEVAMIVDNFRGLKAWERNQWERRRRHQRHMLPSNHPGIIDARWDYDEDEVAEFDPYRNWDASA